MICGRIMIGTIYSAQLETESVTPISLCFFFWLQNIIMYEYLPTLLGEKLPPYTGYKPDLHPGISHIFQSAAFRFGHTLIPPGIYRRDEKCNYRMTQTAQPAVRLCSVWWDSSVSDFLFFPFHKLLYSFLLFSVSWTWQISHLNFKIFPIRILFILTNYN